MKQVIRRFNGLFNCVSGDHASNRLAARRPGSYGPDKTGGRLLEER